MTIYRLGDLSPEIHKTAWVASDANIIGNVTLRKKTSVWFKSTLRGDNEIIEVGAGSNVQENTVMHKMHGEFRRAHARASRGGQSRRTDGRPRRHASESTS